MAVGSLANWCDLVEAAKYHQQDIRKEQQQASTVWGQIGVHTVNKLVSIEALKESKVEFILVTNEPMNAKNVNSALKSKSVLQTHTTYVHKICNHFKGDSNSMKLYKVL